MQKIILKIDKTEYDLAEIFLDGVFPDTTPVINFGGRLMYGIAKKNEPETLSDIAKEKTVLFVTHDGVSVVDSKSLIYFAQKTLKEWRIGYCTARAASSFSSSFLLFYNEQLRNIYIEQNPIKLALFITNRGEKIYAGDAYWVYNPKTKAGWNTVCKATSSQNPYHVYFLTREDLLAYMLDHTPVEFTFSEFIKAGKKTSAFFLSKMTIHDHENF